MWPGVKLLFSEPFETEALDGQLVGKQMNGGAPAESIVVTLGRGRDVELECCQ